MQSAAAKGSLRKCDSRNKRRLQSVSQSVSQDLSTKTFLPVNNTSHHLSPGRVRLFWTPPRHQGIPACFSPHSSKGLHTDVLQKSMEPCGSVVCHVLRWSVCFLTFPKYSEFQFPPCFADSLDLFEFGNDRATSQCSLSYRRDQGQHRNFSLVANNFSETRK